MLELILMLVGSLILVGGLSLLPLHFKPIHKLIYVLSSFTLAYLFLMTYKFIGLWQTALIVFLLLGIFTYFLSKKLGNQEDSYIDVEKTSAEALIENEVAVSSDGQAVVEDTNAEVSTPESDFNDELELKEEDTNDLLEMNQEMKEEIVTEGLQNLSAAEETHEGIDELDIEDLEIDEAELPLIDELDEEIPNVHEASIEDEEEPTLNQEDEFVFATEELEREEDIPQTEELLEEQIISREIEYDKEIVEEDSDKEDDHCQDDDDEESLNFLSEREKLFAQLEDESEEIIEANVETLSNSTEPQAIEDATDGEATLSVFEDEFDLDQEDVGLEPLEDTLAEIEKEDLEEVDEQVPTVEDTIEQEIESIEEIESSIKDENGSTEEPKCGSQKEDLSVRRKRLDKRLVNTFVTQLNLYKQQMSGEEYEMLLLEYRPNHLHDQDYYLFSTILRDFYIETDQCKKLQDLIVGLMNRFENNPIVLAEIIFTQNQLFERLRRNSW